MANQRTIKTGSTHLSPRLGWRDTYSRRLENWAQRSPKLYQILELAVAGLGWACFLILTVLAPLFALSSAIDAISAQATIDWLGLLIAGLLITAWGLIAVELVALRPKLPAGRLFEPDSAPDLAELIEQLIHSFSVRRPDTIVLVPDYTVDCIATPSRGIPLSFKHSLRIGLPVMQTLSPAQFRVMLARAIGGLKLSNQTVAGHIIRLRDACHTYLGMVRNRRSLGAWLLRGFLCWYVPLLTQLSFRAARQCVLDADRHPLEITDDQQVAETITATTIMQRFLSKKYWPSVLGKATLHKQPRVLPYENLEAAVKQLYRLDDAAIWRDEAFAKDVEVMGNKPSFKERLEYIGHLEAPLPSPPQRLASIGYFGAHLPAVKREFDLQWKKQAMPHWKARHASAAKARERLIELQRGLKGAGLTGKQYIEMATLTALYVGKDNAWPVYLKAIELYPKDATVNFFAGRFLLSYGDRTGLRAMAVASKSKVYKHTAQDVIQRFADINRRHAETSALLGTQPVRAISTGQP